MEGSCEDCYRIVCRACGWIAKEEDVIMVQQGKLTACPICGWQPQKKELIENI